MSQSTNINHYFISICWINCGFRSTTWWTKDPPFFLITKLWNSVKNGRTVHLLKIKSSGHFLWNTRILIADKSNINELIRATNGPSVRRLFLFMQHIFYCACVRCTFSIFYSFLVQCALYSYISYSPRKWGFPESHLNFSWSSWIP